MIQGILKVLILPLLFSSGPARNLSFTVDDESWLRLSGTSSVNCFECISASEITKGNMEVSVDDSGGSMTFSNARLKIRVKSFDCRNPRLNRDMHNALGVDKYPEISIELLEAGASGYNESNGSGSTRTRVAISLNGRKKIVEIPVEWRAEGNDRFRFSGTRTLKMSDFGVVPPSPMFGLIKVNDDIDISFNIAVTVKTSQKP